ncbi:MAG TPA: flagellar basal body P-ring protein FlgI [Terriglobales bacterium]|nr:flagellar basal body P-ring protein FlgI [Terriglobales bacterium]
MRLTAAILLLAALAAAAPTPPRTSPARHRDGVPEPRPGASISGAHGVPVLGPAPMNVPISDITTVAGVRDNLLVGYGLVVGLQGTGDRQQTLFTTQTLGNVLQKMGVQIPPAQVMVNNVAAVFVTATLPPFARPGMRIDVTVSSTGDARSLAGGLLLLSPLHGPDGDVYVEAQGPLTVGGFSASGGQSRVQVNQTNVGIIPAGGIVERDTAVDLRQLKQLSLLLREPDFITAQAVASAINQTLGPSYGRASLARAVDSREIDVQWPPDLTAIPRFLAQVEAIPVAVTPPARVVVDERTGTIVIGNNVGLGPVSILHGDLAIEITTSYTASQPTPYSSGGKTELVPQTTITSKDSPASKISLKPGATVQDLVNGLQAIGATARDIVSILRAIKAAGAMEAELVVI